MVVLIRGDRFSDYAAGFALNPPTWSGEGTLFLRHVEGDDLERLRRAYPGRRTWFVEGASRAGGVPRLIGGPLPPLRQRSRDRSP